MVPPFPGSTQVCFTNDSLNVSTSFWAVHTSNARRSRATESPSTEMERAVGGRWRHRDVEVDIRTDWTGVCSWRVTWCAWLDHDVEKDAWLSVDRLGCLSFLAARPGSRRRCEVHLCAQPWCCQCHYLAGFCVLSRVCVPSIVRITVRRWRRRWAMAMSVDVDVWRRGVCRCVRD